MSSNAYAAPLRLDWRESPWIRRYTDLAHLLALASLALAPLSLPGPLTVALAGSVAVSWFWQRFALRRRRRRLCEGRWTWDAAGLWQRDSGALREQLRLRGPSVVLPWIISLRLCDTGGRCRYLLILPHQVDPDIWRLLHIRLRQWGRQGGADHEPA